MRHKRKRKRGLRGLGEVTKKDFQAFASILCRHNASPSLVSDLTRYFSTQNPRFDASRFTAATRTCKP